MARRAFAVGMVVGLVAVVPAKAHDVERTLKPVVEGVVPRVAGISVEVGTVVAPALSVRWSGRRPLEVIGTDGMPFVRLGPRGVEANVASPDLYRSNAPVPGASVPSAASAGADPVWVRIATKPAWSWFEHRLDARRARVGEPWTIPVRLSGRPVRIRGRWTSAVIRGVFRTVVDGVRPRVDGVSIEALGGTQALLVQNSTGELLELADEAGNAFLRVGPKGVQMRRRGGPWTKMGTTPAWAWLERRAGSPRRDWSIPAKLGARPLAIVGHVEWRPISAHHEAGESRIGLLLAAAAAPLLLGALLFWRLKR